MQGENRLFERVRVRFPMKFSRSDQGYGTDVFIRDVSAGGLKFTSRKSLFINDSVSLEVDLSDGHLPMELNGRVVWMKEKAPDVWDIGMAFHKVNLMRLQRLFKLASV